MAYVVIDLQDSLTYSRGIGTGAKHYRIVAGPFTTRRRANRRADALNLAHGAHRYAVRVQA